MHARRAGISAKQALITQLRHQVAGATQCVSALELGAPAARGRTATEEESSHAKLITSVLERFVKEHLGDARECSFRLATGKLSGPPFSPVALGKLRRELANTVPDSEGALKVPEGQPFLLNFVAQSLQILGDPDWSVLTQGTECFANGMPIGYDQPLPRAPQVFRKKTKFRKFDEPRARCACLGAVCR